MKLHLLLIIPLFALCFVTTAFAQRAGNLDITFNHTGFVYDSIDSDQINWAEGMALQNDGKIVVVGYTEIIPDSFNYSSILRYNSDGSLDTSFNHTGFVVLNYGSPWYSSFNSVAIQPNGKIVVLGWQSLSDSSTFLLARFNINGSIDTTFGKNGIALTSVYGGGVSVLLQSDGKIIAGGGNSDTTFVIVRCDTTGRIDTTFGNKGYIYSNSTIHYINLRVLALDSGDNILAACGYVSGSVYTNYGLFRYDVNGSLDSTFAINGMDTLDSYFISALISVAVAPDNKIVAVGITGGLNTDIIRFNSDGSLDSSFNHGGVSGYLSNMDAANVLIQTDEKIIACGTGIANGFALIRLNVDGSTDTSFGDDGYVSTLILSDTYDFIDAAALQNDGKIVVAGYTNAIQGVNDYIAVARYNNDISAGIPMPSTPIQSVFIYPNPTTGQFIIKSRSNQNGYTVNVYNELGQMVFTITSPQTNEVQDERIDLSSQPAGLYIVELNSNAGAQVGEVLVTR